MIKLELARNNNGKRWHWWITWSKDGLVETEKQMRIEGYHLVSKDSFVRPNGGIRINCLLYQN
ncbi:MAG TPA: hypothetical protein DIC56_05655 [Rhizobium sp.]|nr:hypothetical protein [Rhizobium sp.]